MTTSRLASWLIVGCLWAIGCRPENAVRRPARTTIQACEYRVRLDALGQANVSARCAADGEVSFRAPLPSIAARLSSDAPRESGGFRAEDGRLEYALDLAALAEEAEDLDVAMRVGDSFVAPMSTLLVVPEPLTTRIPVRVWIEGEPGVRSSTGLTRDDEAGGYRLMANEISTATYLAFGKLEQRTLELPSGRLEVARLDGPMDRSFDELIRWIDTSARAVSDFYGVFPVPRATITIIPAPGREAVVFGKVLPESAPGIALRVGERVNEDALRSDWILIHELYHLGFPSFIDEGKWLDEGLATYYEPIIRVRAGLYTELELWDELERSLPQGLPAFTDFGLEQAEDFKGIYWGGAIACLVADVEARRREVSRGLEVGLRALREAGGNASEVLALKDAIHTIDRALGASVLSPIARRHAARGSPFDLKALLTELGVERDAQGKLQLSDDAPLAAIRRAITTGEKHEPTRQ